MRSAHLHLDLGGSWIRARLLRPRGWYGGATDCLFEARRPANGTEAPLGEALRGLLTEIAATGAQVRGARLRVELGMAHACVGLMRVADGVGSRLAASTLHTYVTAWAQQTLHRDPAAHIMRWQVSRDPHHVLVTCVSRSTFDTLTAFADEHGLRFDRCVPAVVNAIRTARPRPAHTLVWTEGLGQRRDPSVQLLRLDRGQVHATWRGWAPASKSDAEDPQLQGALARFSARYGNSEGGQDIHVQWPDKQAGMTAAM
jgi:hypothetical protein